jgi:uroporphyrinogen decarboxylase
MTSRERVLCSLQHQEPDRVPVHADFTRTIAKKLAHHLGCDFSRVGEELGNDLVILKPVSFVPAMAVEEFVEFTDEWGIRWKKIGNYYERTNFPFCDLEDLEAVTLPDPHDPSRYTGMEEMIRKYRPSHAVMGNVTITIFERAWWLRGMEKFLEDMILNPDFAHKLLDLAMEFSLTAALKLVNMGVDILWLGDDVGMQQTMLISPELWREYLKPRYVDFIRRIREADSGVYIAYHSDGYIEPIIDELVEIGIQILNPIQPQCMDPARIKGRYGKRLVLWGLIDVQRTLPFGSPEDVAAEVRLRIRSAGENGGLILSPAHYIQADTPLENIFTFYETAVNYRR